MIKINTQKGYALYTAIILTGLLIIVAYGTATISTRQLQLSVSSADSQIAVYAADSGIECALYADIKNGAISAFDISTPGTVSCLGVNITSGSQTVPTNPTQTSVVGGGGAGNPVSIFSISTNPGCAIVRVTKNPDLSTIIESRGYNTCSTGIRFERGMIVTY